MGEKGPGAEGTAPAAPWTRLGSNYGEEYYLDREAWPDFRREVGEILALARLVSSSRVLELGCGGGEMLRRLERRVRVAVGVDLSAEALRLAHREAVGSGRTLAPRLLCARAEALPFARASFDAVLAQHLVEHLPDPAPAFSEWRRVLRPGGVLALVTPNAAYPDPAHFADPSHVSLLTPAALRSALEAAGFRVVHLSTLFPYLGRGRLARAASIRLAPLARRVPLFAARGRSIVAAAVG